VSYYSDYETELEEKDGNLESKWDPVADMNIIKSGMSLLAMITKQNGTIGPVSNVSFKKLGDGLNMSLRAEFSGAGWTMSWENTDSESCKNSKIVFSLTEEDKEIGQFPWSWITAAETEKHT